MCIFFLYTCLKFWRWHRRVQRTQTQGWPFSFLREPSWIALHVADLGSHRPRLELKRSSVANYR